LIAVSWQLNLILLRFCGVANWIAGLDFNQLYDDTGRPMTTLNDRAGTQDRGRWSAAALRFSYRDETPSVVGPRS
jgi:hypothetical protein